MKVTTKVSIFAVLTIVENGMRVMKKFDGISPGSVALFNVRKVSVIWVPFQLSEDWKAARVTWCLTILVKFNDTLLR